MNFFSQPGRGAECATVVNGEQLNRLVSMSDAIESSRRAFRAAAGGEVRSPLRMGLSRGRVLVMPAEHRSGSVVVKILNVGDSLSDGRSTTSGLALWLEPDRGDLALVVDGGALTALRTGAASGLATELLAHPQSAVLAMLGSGGQASQQIAGILAVRPIEEVRIYSAHLGRSQSLCRDLDLLGTGVTYRAVSTAREALAGADVVCTATRAQSALFGLGDLAGSVHINAIGSYRPEMREIPPEVFSAASAVVVDQAEAVLSEAGDLMAAVEAGVVRRRDLVELGDLLVKEGRAYGGITIFKSVGIAAQDWALMEVLIDKVRSCAQLSGPEIDARPDVADAGFGEPSSGG